jgi:hypothetical protein
VFNSTPVLTGLLQRGQIARTALAASSDIGALAAVGAMKIVRPSNEWSS